MAEEHGLPGGWLSDAVKGCLAGPAPDATPVLDLPGLRVLAASPRYLLTMKCLAARRADEEDIRFLLRLTGVTSAEEAIEVLLSHYPEARVPPRARFLPRRVERYQASWAS